MHFDLLTGLRPLLLLLSADAVLLTFLAYPLVMLLSGQGRDVKWLMYVMAVVLVVYFVVVRVPMA